MWRRLSKLDASVKVMVVIGALFMGFFISMTIAGSFTEEWTAYCGAAARLTKTYSDLPSCWADVQTNHKVMGGDCGCKRSDWPMVAQMRVLDILRRLTGHAKPET
jgi:hypothetical protein